MLCTATTAWGVRVDTEYSSVINPIALHSVATLMQSGDHLIGGGVFLEAESKFTLEQGSTDVNVRASDLALSYNNGTVTIIHFSGSFNYSMHPEMVCPLGRFVRRDGRLVVSLPDDRSASAERKLVDMGLRNYRGTGVWVAEEFTRNSTIALLLGMDFANDVDLPVEITARIVALLNRRIGAGDLFSRRWDSYFNTDSMTNVTTFLVSSLQHAETSGVPLRFYWKREGDRTRVTDVDIFSQDLGAPQISNLRTLNLPAVHQMTQRDLDDMIDEFNQIDFIKAYQAAAVFRAINRGNPDQFLSFLRAACADTRNSGVRR